MPGLSAVLMVLLSAPAPPSALVPAARAAIAAALQQHDMQPAPEQHEGPALHIAGFGDINYAATKHLEGARGFTLGQLVLHMSSELSPRVSFFGELSFTARTDAGTGSPPAGGFNTEVERMSIRFDHSDKFKMSFGRYHTPINYWNTAFHHGQWLQTTITRPEMIQFGGKFLPVHFVGALVEGVTPAGGLNLNYQAGIGNGRNSVISRAGDAGDVNGNRAVLATAFVKPDQLYGLQTGGSVYVDTITLSSGRTFSERIVSAHVVWNKENPELIAEFAAVRHDENTAATATWSKAFYVQAAYRLEESLHQYKPYFRFEHVGVNATDAVYAGVLNLDGATLGVRYDLTAYAAVKGEYRTWTRGTGSVRNHGAFLQVSFTF